MQLRETEVTLNANFNQQLVNFVNVTEIVQTPVGFLRTFLFARLCLASGQHANSPSDGRNLLPSGPASGSSSNGLQGMG